MKFAMGAETLTVLTKQTSSANDDLGSLSAEPASAIPAKGAATRIRSGSVGRGVAATGEPALTA